MSTAPPPSEKLDNKFLEEIFSNQHPTVVLGDFNAHHEMWYSSRHDGKGTSLADAAEKSGYILLNKKINTRDNITGQDSLLDLTFVTPQLGLTANHTVLNTTFGSDHHPIRLVLNAETCTPTTTGKNFNKINKQLFMATLDEALETKLNRSRPATCVEKYGRFVDSINMAINASTPDRRVPKNNQYKSLPY